MTKKQGIEYLQGRSKRSFDLIGGSIASSLLIAPAAGIAAVSAIDTQSLNPILKQDRVGGNGDNSFQTLKFRTLRRQVGEMAMWQSFGAFDPRASRLGVFIRQAGLDEMPQLINVLLGDMSLIGTRPLASQDLERNQLASPKLFDEWYSYFSVIKPGLTGEGQIYRHHYREGTSACIAKSMEMDLKYFETATLVGDITWALKTPGGIAKANIGVVEKYVEETEQNIRV